VAILRAQISLPGRDWPDLAGATVAARWPGGDGRAQTDPWGEAVIPGVPLGQIDSLVIEVATPTA
jgi:hypothetical protein